MISERTRGLKNTLLLCQAGLELLVIGFSMLVSFTYIVETTPEQLWHYPFYAVLLLMGLLLEAAARNEHVIPENPLQRRFTDQFHLSARQTGYSVGVLFIYMAAAKDATVSRTFLAVFVPLLGLVLLWSNRKLPVIIAHRFFEGLRRERAVLIGSSARADQLRRWLCTKALFGFEAVGLVNDEEQHEPVTGLPWLGNLVEVERIIREHGITKVILLSLPEDEEAHERLVDVLEDRAVRIMILSNLEEKLRHPVVHIEEDGLSFVTTREEPLENPFNRVLKRTLDLVVAVPTVLLLMPPLFVLVWVLHRLQSPGPVFYRQMRAGLQNTMFPILKFRTMHADNPDPTRQASQNDVRIFTAGRWLRRLSIDEIPQFWNVIRGEMSLVGPRPHLPEHNEDFARQMGRYHMRSLVKPGVTGLAQLRGFRGEVHSVADIQARLESDIAYLEAWSLSLDILIIVRTAMQMVFLLANSLLLRRARPVYKEDDRDIGYRRGELLGGVVQDVYQTYNLRRSYRQILGIRFFTGSAAEAVALGMQGGLIVAPAAPLLISVAEHPVHRAALVSADLAITDSGLMVLLWHLITGEHINRVSGLEYLKLLLEQPQLRQPGASFWIMPHEASMRRNLDWLNQNGFNLSPEDCYLAPNYSSEHQELVDLEQLKVIQRRRPQHIIMCVGGGVQERLGAELRRRLDYRPSIYCLGAAIGFLSGDQTHIPMWADRLRLGWLFRTISDPVKFFPRYWESRKLLSLMLEHQGRLPVSGKVTKPAPGSAAGK